MTRRPPRSTLFPTPPLSRSVQTRYSVGARQSEDVLEYCEREGMGFLPWYPLAAGSLARRGPVAPGAQRTRATPAQVGIARLLPRAPVLLPLPRPSTVTDLEGENQAALPQPH